MEYHGDSMEFTVFSEIAVRSLGGVLPICGRWSAVIACGLR